MAFKLIVHPDLRDSLEDSLPGPVLELLSDALYQRLAVPPTQWSKPADFPFAKDHQVFDCAVHHAGGRYLFRISFRYGQDEESLHIGDIRWTVGRQNEGELG